MPSIEYTDCNQTAVLWEVSGTDSYGQPTHESPVEIKVRWAWRRRNITVPKSGTITLDAFVKVLREIPVDSLMWLGKLDDWYDSGSGGSDTGLCIVKAVAFSPDLKGREMLREVGLMRYKDTA